MFFGDFGKRYYLLHYLFHWSFFFTERKIYNYLCLKQYFHITGSVKNAKLCPITGNTVVQWLVWLSHSNVFSAAYLSCPAWSDCCLTEPRKHSGGFRALPHRWLLHSRQSFIGHANICGFARVGGWGWGRDMTSCGCSVVSTNLGFLPIGCKCVFMC